MTDEEKIALDLYWKMYNEHATQGRHHETLRATVSGLLVAAVAALIGLGKSDGQAVQIGWTVVSISVLGCLLNLKHYERNRLHTTVLAAFHDQMNSIMNNHNLELSAINNMARDEHETFRLLSGLPLNMLWIVIFAILAMFGWQLGTITK